MTDLRVSGGFVLGAFEGLASDVRVLSGHALVATQAVSDAVRAYQSYVLTAATFEQNVKVYQSYVLVAIKGRTVDPRIRTWTFTLDGKDFYVLRIGETETLIYDVAAEQWYVWGSGDTDLWTAYQGCNWLGCDALAYTYGSNVIVGDDVNGALYFLDPENSYDDDPDTGSADPRQFLRTITGQYPVRGYKREPCYGVQVYGSLGEMADVTLTAVTLSTSDDGGNSYTSRGTVTVSNTDYGARAEWRSLGSMSTPGRLFKLTDYGTLHRVDGMELREAS